MEEEVEERGGRYTININREAAELLEAVVAYYEREIGVKLTRPQALSLTMKYYLRKESPSKDIDHELELMRQSRLQVSSAAKG